MSNEILIWSEDLDPDYKKHLHEQIYGKKRL
jgi:hypothetical protein